MTEAGADRYYAPAFVVDGPLQDSWIYTVHDPGVPLPVSGNEIDGEVIYTFSDEDGRPTLRILRNSSE